MKRNPAYRGYLIRRSLTGQTFIEKGEAFIAWAKSESDAKKQIDMLVNPPKKRRRRNVAKRRLSSRYSPEARKFLETEIAHLIGDKSYPRARAVKAALEQARRLGYKVPARSRNVDPMLLDIIGPGVDRATRAITGKKPKPRARARRRNPKDEHGAVLKALRRFLGPTIGEHVLRIEYRGGEGKPKHSRWYHDFEKLGARVIGLKDGSLFIKRGNRPLWRMFD